MLFLIFKSEISNQKSFIVTHMCETKFGMYFTQYKRQYVYKQSVSNDQHTLLFCKLQFSITSSQSSNNESKYGYKLKFLTIIDNIHVQIHNVNKIVYSRLQGHHAKSGPGSFCKTLTKSQNKIFSSFQGNLKWKTTEHLLSRQVF